MFYVQFCSEKRFYIKIAPLQIIRSVLCANSRQYIPALLSKILFAPLRTVNCFTFLCLEWFRQTSVTPWVHECMESINGRYEDIIWYIKPVSEVNYERTQLNWNILVSSHRAASMKPKVKTNQRPTIFSSKLLSAEVQSLRLYIWHHSYFYKSGFRIDLFYC